MSTELSLYGQIIRHCKATEDNIDAEISRQHVRWRRTSAHPRRPPVAAWRKFGGALMEPLGRNGKMRALLAAKSRPRWWERLRDWWRGVDRQTSATVEER